MIETQPRRDGAISTHMFDKKHHRRNELWPPRWGFMGRDRTVTQAGGLGWHGTATLWRKKPGFATASLITANELLAEFWKLEKEAEKMLEGLSQTA